MKAVLISGGLAMVVALLGTPLFIRFLVRKQYGQFIRQDGPTAHFTKRGTPTMGGVVIIGRPCSGGRAPCWRPGPSRPRPPCWCCSS